MRIDRAITYSVQNRVATVMRDASCVNAAVRDRLYILIHAMIDSNEPSTEQKKQELHVARLKHV
jgi:hypothetical protein